MQTINDAIRNNDMNIPTMMPMRYYEVTGKFLSALKEAAEYYATLSEGHRGIARAQVEMVEGFYTTDKGGK